MRAFRRTAGLVAALGLLAGCGGLPADLDVTGEVTLDGAPVGTGTDALVRFEPTAGSTHANDAPLNAGKYSVKLQPGTYKVSVTWNKPTGKKDPSRPKTGPGSEGEATAQAVPAKYNTATTLTADVTSASRKHDFTLTSK